MVPPLAAIYFDGRSARRHEVTLTLEGDVAHIAGDGIDRSAPLSELRISEPMGAAPRLITFPDGAICEVRDLSALARILAQTGHRDHFVVRWQTSLRWVAASLIVTIAIVAAGYRWGLPWFAAGAAQRIPDAVAEHIGDHVLQVLDESLLQPSQLPDERRAQLAERFETLSVPDARPLGHEVVFRASRHLGANALALPSGNIILTDDLVRLAQDDEEIMAVLAHELGHVQERHGLRLMLQSSIAGALAAWYVGDVSTLLAAAPVLLAQAKYSRDFENAADEYAARMLTANGLSPSRLADLLERMDAAHAPRKAGAADQSEDDGYLATHPATRDRIAVLRAHLGR